MIVAVSVPAQRVAAWHALAIDALRATPAIEVRVICAGGAPWNAPRGLLGRASGSTLAAATVTCDAADSAAAYDVVLDLCGGVPAAEGVHGRWFFDFEGEDPALPFARAILAGAAIGCISLVRERRGVCEVLRRGCFAVGIWYAPMLRIALNEAAGWPATFAAAAVAGIETVGETCAVPHPAPVLLPAERRALVPRMLARMISGTVSGHVANDVWNIGFADGGPARALSGSLGPVRWLPAPAAGTFVADPFIIERDGLRVLFYEDLDHRTDCGTIDALILEGETPIRRLRAIERTTHLSYPFPLEIDGELYLVPENNAAGEVALYRCVRFPDVWEREAALLPNYDGVDTTVFAHEGKWWAFGTRYHRGSNLALFAHVAPSPRGPWTPHALNPIIVDATRARPAGAVFSHEGRLYRPGQDCSATYGGAVEIARIDELTPTAYRESPICRLALPAGTPFADGLHTIGFLGDLIVIDGKRSSKTLRYVPRRFQALGAALRRQLVRLAG